MSPGLWHARRRALHIHRKIHAPRAWRTDYGWSGLCHLAGLALRSAVYLGLGSGAELRLWTGVLRWRAMAERILWGGAEACRIEEERIGQYQLMEGRRL